MVLEAIVSANSTNEAYIHNQIALFIQLATTSTIYEDYMNYNISTLTRVFKLMRYKTLYVKHCRLELLSTILNRLERHQNQLHALYIE